MHAVSPEQFAAAEQRHEQEKVVAKQVKEKGVVKDTEALRVSMDQLREVIYASSREVEDLWYTLQPTRTKESSELKYVALVATFFFNCGNVLVTNYVPLQAVAGYVLHSYLACGQAVGFVPKS